MSISWPSFLLGVVIGFAFGALFISLVHRHQHESEAILAWVISLVWVCWHVAAGLALIASAPPTIFDLVAGGSVGFVLGERFFDYVSILRKK